MKPYYDHNGITIYHGNALEVMGALDVVVDAIICDPPYGTTNCAWDSVIPFAPMWAALKRLTKPRAPMVLFGSQPFTSALVMSWPQGFKYQWVWNKRISGNPLLAEAQPMKVHEDVIVFSDGTHNYYPQMRQGEMRRKGGGYSKLWDVALTSKLSDQYFPTSILDVSNAVRGEHLTAKPLALMEYLILTYTNPDELVLDFTMGSGTTLRAAKNLGRRAIGIEQDEGFCSVAARRLSQEVMELA